MKNKKLYIYEVNEKYTNYLRQIESKVSNEKKNRKTRKYVGILLFICGIGYIAPLSSIKIKHKKINEKAVDLVKLGDMSVINLNNMIPVKKSVIKKIEFSDITDINYRNLLLKEYAIINKQKNVIISKANRLYRMMNKSVSDMSEYELKIKQRCINFKKLELLSKYY